MSHWKIWGETIEQLLDRQVEEKVLLVPGHCFYIETVRIDSAVDLDEINDFLILRLEEFSPFPIEKLMWGYLLSSNNLEAILYATRMDSLEKEGHKEIDSYQYVVPDFLSVCKASVVNPTAVVYHAGKFAILAKYLKDSEFASSLEYCFIDEVSSFSDSVNDDSSLIGPIEMHVNTNCNEDSHLTIQLENEIACLKKLVLDPDAGLTSDIRDRNFLLEKKAIRTKQSHYWKWIQYSASVCAILLLFQFILLGWGFYIEDRATQLSDNQSSVQLIMNKHELYQELEKATSQQITPLQTLSIINKERPLEIHFKQLVTDEDNVTLVRGEAVNATTITNFNEKLKRVYPSSQLKLKSINTRNGKTFFTLEIISLEDFSVTAKVIK